MKMNSRKTLISRALLALVLAVTGCRAFTPKPVDENPNPSVADLVDYRNGLALLREGRADEALIVLQRARVSYPSSAEVANALGLVLLYKKDYPRAIKQFTDALAIDGKLVEALNNRGVAFMEMGDLAKAETDFEALLDGPQGREKVNARFNVSILRSKQHLWQEAETGFSLVLADDAGYMKAYRERGLARFQLDDFTGALDDLLRYLKVDQKDPQAHYYAALCMVTKGRRDLAVKYLEKTVELAPDSEEGKKARRFLEGETYSPQARPEDKR